MPTPIFFPLAPVSATTPSLISTPSPTGQARAAGSFLGAGLLTPFRRDQKSDLAHGAADVLVRACLEQLLGTECGTDDGSVQGELPWRPEFGSVLYRLRQRPNDETTARLAAVFVGDAVRRWEPRLQVSGVSATRRRVDPKNIGGPDALFIGVRYKIISANVAANEVVLPERTVEVRV